MNFLWRSQLTVEVGFCYSLWANAFHRKTQKKKVRTMSQHSSLKGSSKITARRNVLKRYERVDLLVKRGVIKKDNVRSFGLPKTKPEE